MHTVLIGLRCWWHLALPVGLVLAATVGVATYAFMTPRYTASTWLLIRERPFVLVANHVADDSRKFVENQIELLRSAPVLEPVASDPSIATMPEMSKELDPIGYLRKKLQIRALGKSDFFEVSFTSTSPEKAALVVNRVAKEYYELQGRHESKSTSRTIELLQEQQIARQQVVRQLRTTLQELSKQIFGKDAFAVQRHDDNRPTANPLAEMEQRLIAAEVDKETLAARIQAEKELLAKESFEPSPTDVAAFVETIPQVQHLRQSLEANRGKLAEHKTKSVDVAKNSLYQHLRREVTVAEADLERLVVELRDKAKEEVAKLALAKRENSIAELEGQLRALQVSARVWSERLKDKRGIQVEVAADSLQYELIKADYNRASQLLDAISSRILTMQTEQRAPERVEIFRTADVPSRPDESVAYKKVGLAVTLALLAPFALAIGVEMLYQRVSNKQQLATIAPLGMVAEVTTLPTRSKIHTEAANRGFQLYEESIDGLRTFLSLMDAMKGHKVLAVTSAISREGKTSVASQLAVSIASSSNRPTLLIDGDMRAPDLHRIFTVDSSPGLCEVLHGEVDPDEAIDTSISDTLHLLTAGDLDRSPHRLVGNGVFIQLIAKLRERYDYIVIDTPPILPASEALLMASVADAAIVCVRRDYSRLNQVMETFHRLNSAGVNTVGTVLNGVPQQLYRYRYGSYYYAKKPIA